MTADSQNLVSWIKYSLQNLQQQLGSWAAGHFKWCRGVTKLVKKHLFKERGILCLGQEQKYL